MNDNFTTEIAARLQEFVNEQLRTTAVGTATPHLAPLQERLKRVLDQVPHSIQQEGLSLLQLQTYLRGRKGGLPHIGELGGAMRRLGWQRRRAWSDETTSFSSRWYPENLN